MHQEQEVETFSLLLRGFGCGVALEFSLVWTIMRHGPEGSDIDMRDVLNMSFRPPVNALFHKPP